MKPKDLVMARDPASIIERAERNLRLAESKGRSEKGQIASMVMISPSDLRWFLERADPTLGDKHGVPAVHSYDSSGEENTVTLRWPSGNYVEYERTKPE